MARGASPIAVRDDEELRHRAQNFVLVRRLWGDLEMEPTRQLGHIGTRE